MARFGRWRKAPYCRPTAIAVSLAKRNGNSESRAQDACIVSASALMAISTTFRPPLKICAY